MRLEGAAAIVTGGGTGVGAATALRLARKGAHVIVNYSRSAEEAERTVEACRALGVEAKAARADVSRDEDCRALVAAAEEAWGRLDVLVNSAGTTRFIPHEDLDAVTPEIFDAIFAVNLRGPFQMCRAAVALMRRTGQGAIVNVSSVSGIVGDGSSIPYAASKGALNTLTRSLARLLAPEIRVNAVCPDYIAGRWMRNGVGDEAYERIMTDARRKSAIDRVAEPDDIAEAILWLLEGAAFITGDAIVVDGGIHLGKNA